MAWQRHGATVTRAQPRGIVTPGTVYDHCDGLWSDAPGRAMLLLTADCMPIAIARGTACGPRSRSFTPAGAGCSPASSRRAFARSARAKLAAVIGPSIGPCCYEVGDEVATPFRQAFGDDVVRDGEARPLDLGGARAAGGRRRAGRALRPLHVLRPASDSSRTGATTARTGRQGVIAYVV